MDYIDSCAGYTPSYLQPNYTYSFGPKEDSMEVFHNADEFTIVRQANKMGGITVGYTYYKITKISVDEAKFYKDSGRDAQAT